MYKLFTDMFADLPEMLAEELELTVVPNNFTMNGNHYEHSYQNNHPEEFYAALRAGSLPETSQINSETFKELFTPVLAAGEDILYIAFSSNLSGTCNSARLAAEELAALYPERRVVIIDSLAASLGQGLLVYYAAKKRQEGYTLDKLATWLEANKLNIHHWFTVDNLFHLRRGGRISGAAAIVGSLLSIKPVLHMNEQGKLVPVVKLKGRKKALQALVDKMEELGTNIDGQPIFISHGDSLEDALYLQGLIEAKYPKCTFTLNFVGPVIGAHSGPGTIALFFVGTQR